MVGASARRALACYFPTGGVLLNDYERDVVAAIAEHGWFCVSVAGGEQASFAYTVGFTETLGAPECIVFGLPSELMHSMLWEVFRRVQAGSLSLADGETADLLQDHDCCIRTVHPTQVVLEHFNSAMWYRKTQMGLSDPPEAVQIVWPSVGSRRFPWEEGFPAELLQHQPSLFLAQSKKRPSSFFGWLKRP